VSFKATSAVSNTSSGFITLTEAGTAFNSISGFIVSDTTSNASPAAATSACGGTITPPCYALSNSNHTITIYPGLTIAAGDSISVTLLKVTNPPAGTISDFYVSTSGDPVAQPAASFSISPATSTSVTTPVTVTASPNSPGYLATWTISGLSVSSALTGGTSTIEISGSSSDSNCTTCAGLVFPNAASDYTITDSTTSSGSGTASAVVAGGGTSDVIIKVANSIKAGDSVTITIAAVVNPSSGTATANLALGASVAGNSSLGGANLTTNGVLAAAVSTVPVFPGANLTYPNGAIVNFGGTYYVFAGGHAFGFPTPAQLIGVQAVDHAVVQTAATGVSVPNSAPRPGTLIVVYNNPTIYVVGSDGALHGFATPTQFLQSGYDSALVITVPTLGGLTVSTSTVGALGSAANALATSSDGAIVNSSGTFYVFAGGRAFGIATPAQLMTVQAGNYTSTVLSGSISTAATSATIANGVLVTIGGTVYVSNGGQLLAFKSMTQLMADGFGGTPSIILPNAGGLSLVTNYSGS
jgi:hypothetical protein